MREKVHVRSYLGSWGWFSPAHKHKQQTKWGLVSRKVLRPKALKVDLHVVIWLQLPEFLIDSNDAIMQIAYSWHLTGHACICYVSIYFRFDFYKTNLNFWNCFIFFKLARLEIFKPVLVLILSREWAGVFVTWALRLVIRPKLLSRIQGWELNMWLHQMFSSTLSYKKVKMQKLSVVILDVTKTRSGK